MISIKEDFELTFDNVNKYLANHPEKAILLSPITEYPFLKGIKRRGVDIQKISDNGQVFIGQLNRDLPKRNYWIENILKLPLSQQHQALYENLVSLNLDRQNLQIPQQMGTIVLAGEMFGIIIMQLGYLLEQKLLQQFLVKHYSMTSLMINSSILVIFLKKKKKQDLEMPEHLILLLMVNML